MNLNEFQLACRKLRERQGKENPTEALLDRTLNQVGLTSEVMYLVDAFDPRLKNAAYDVVAANGKLAELVRQNLYGVRQKDHEANRQRAFEILGQMLVNVSTFADMIKRPLAEIAAAAVKEKPHDGR